MFTSSLCPYGDAANRRQAQAGLTEEGVGDGDLQPHTVPDLQPGLRGRHRLGDRRHVGVQREVEVVEACSCVKE